jgi:hypothetical protein
MAPKTSFHEYWQVENVKSLMQEKLTPLKGMIKKDDSSYYLFFRQYREFSRMTEERKNSYEEVLHKQSVLPSSPEKGNRSKRSPEKDAHSQEGMNKFPTGKWSTYPCDSCGTSNHDMEKC